MKKKFVRTIAVLTALLALSACRGGEAALRSSLGETQPIVRQPVVPEMLVNCGGHVLVPALKMTIVRRGEQPPATGQYLREERLTPPYRIIPPGASLSAEQSPKRLNIEVDYADRIIGLFCG